MNLFRTSFVEHQNNTSSRLRIHNAAMTATKMKSKLLTLSLSLFFTCNVCYAKVHSINQGIENIRMRKLEQNEGTSSIETSVKSISETKSMFEHVLRSTCPDCNQIKVKVIETKRRSSLLYTFYDTVYVPPGGIDNQESIRHEIGHVIRYVCFGSQSDVSIFLASFNLIRSHSCKRKASAEFSFNEGWATFWAGQCDNLGSSIHVEGDVAHSLRSLQRRCGSTKREMVKVLCDNPGRVRTYPDFENYHQRMYRCS